MSIEDYLQELEKDIEQRNEAIEATKRQTETILRQANAQIKENPEEVVLTDQPEPVQPKTKKAAANSQEEKDYQKQIQMMAQQMATKGVDPKVIQNLGPEAELQYLRSRVTQLEQLISQQNTDYQKLLLTSSEQRENLQIAQTARDKLQKQVSTQQSKLILLQKENEQLQVKVSTLQDQLTDIQNKTDSATKIAQNGITANQQKEKQINRLIDQIEVLKKQLQESVEREVLLKEKFDEGNSAINQERKKKDKENEELNAIVKKQQQLIDVLQRQKLHLQGAISLGFTEAEFQKVLDK